jgi:hypothetical protein
MLITGEPLEPADVLLRAAATRARKACKVSRRGECAGMPGMGEGGEKGAAQ